jgi:hypothetical protein
VISSVEDKSMPRESGSSLHLTPLLLPYKNRAHFRLSASVSFPYFCEYKRLGTKTGRLRYTVSLRKTDEMIKEVKRECFDSAGFVKEWRYTMKILLSAKTVLRFVLIWLG